MISGYHEIINYEGDDWEDFLTTICLIDIFKDLIEKYEFKNKSELKAVIKFILDVYSKDSRSIILGDDWYRNKVRVFDSTFLPKEHFESLVNLKSSVVVSTIRRWVDFQDNEVYTNLCSLKDLMTEMRTSSNSTIKKSNEEVDYDQKFKNARYVQDLQSMIKDLESELMQNDMRLKEGLKELKKVGKQSHTLGVERYAV